MSLCWLGTSKLRDIYTYEQKILRASRTTTTTTTTTILFVPGPWKLWVLCRLEEAIEEGVSITAAHSCSQLGLRCPSIPNVALYAMEAKFKPGQALQPVVVKCLRCQGFTLRQNHL